MIIALGNLESANDGKTKTVLVFAQEDNSGGSETLQFIIIDQTVTTKQTFKAGEGKTVTVTHTASGKGLVIASAVGSKESAMLILDVDKQPGDDGT